MEEELIVMLKLVMTRFCWLVVIDVVVMRAGDEESQ